MKTKLATFVIALAFSAATLTVHATDIVWTNTAGGNWSTAANWSPNQVPGAADNAYLTNNGTYTVTVNANASSGTVTIGGTSGTQTLNLSAGTFTLNGSGTGNAQSALTISGGTLAGSGDVTINGAMSWTGGTMSGAGKTIIAGSGSLSLSGTTHYLNRVLQNDGAATWTVGMCSLNGGTINNNGSFAANASGPLDCRGEGGGNAFNNSGTFTQQGAGTTSVLRNFADVSFNNSGTVAVLNGTLGCDTGGTQSGHFTVASSATLRLNGTHTFGLTADIAGPGNVSVPSGTTTLNGSFTSSASLGISGSGTVNGNGTLTFGSGSLSAGTLAGSGDVTINGALSWTGGTMSGTGKTVIAGTGSLSLSGTTHYLNRVLQNDGAATWTVGMCSLNGGTINNNGSFTASASGLLECRGEGGVNAFNNSGTFTQQGAGTTSVLRNFADVSFNNSGTVAVLNGTLGCDTGGTQSGHFTVASSATLRLNGSHAFGLTADIAGPGNMSVPGGTTTLNGSFISSASLGISGTGTVNANGTLTFGSGNLASGTLAGSGDVTISGAMSWTGGTMSGSGKTVIAGTASLSLSGTTHYLNRVLQNDGTATWTVGNCFLNGGTLNNNGSFTANASGPLDYRGEGGVNAFNNSGTFTQQGAGTTSVLRNFADVSFNNSGTVETRGGVLQVAQPYVQSAGLTLLLGGRLQVSQGLALNGGTLAGTNTLTGNVNNTGGILSAGVSPGKLTITGNYVQSSGGAITVELGGTNTGTGFDLLAVGGSATLAGTLNASLYGGFYPAPAATFNFLTAASRSGTFSAFNYPSTIVGLTVDYAATTATIRVINTLPVITPIGDRNSDELVPFNLTAVANDYDAPPQTVTWSLGSGPAGLSISSGGAISWTPGEEVGPSTNSVTVRVTDNGTPNLTATNIFQLVIYEINVAPMLTLPAHQAVDELTLLSVSAAATDSDIPTNELTFELVAGPPGLTVLPGGAITWTPTEAQGPGDYPVTVRVTDYNPDAINEKHLSTTNTFSVTVNEVNFAPVLAGLTNHAVNPGQTNCCTAAATDSDAPTNSLTFSLLNPPTGATIDGSNGLVNWRPPVAQANTTNVVQVQVMDDNPSAVNARHLSDTKSFTVIVNPLEPVRLTPISLVGGQFLMEVSGTVGPDYIIQASSAFSDWQNLWTNTPAVLPFSFTDTNAGSFSNCFYRVLLGP